ncbi:MAG: 50S ribosomal protein L23 [Clostridia bacterium]|nr:50S ribosomal protein L23 [Clostridia bacterium]MBQ3869825.1 50S ribosomal protein L23 [Clostridia bacterium]
MKTVYDVIVRPIVTEATMGKMAEKKYSFEVLPTATKSEIAAAVEKVFNVKVAKVNVLNVKRKPKRLGVHAGYTRAWKKATVTLTPDSKTIAFFDGIM